MKIYLSLLFLTLLSFPSSFSVVFYFLSLFFFYLPFPFSLHFLSFFSLPFFTFPFPFYRFPSLLTFISSLPLFAFLKNLPFIPSLFPFFLTFPFSSFWKPFPNALKSLPPPLARMGEYGIIYTPAFFDEKKFHSFPFNHEWLSVNINSRPKIS